MVLFKSRIGNVKRRLHINVCMFIKFLLKKRNNPGDRLYCLIFTAYSYQKTLQEKFSRPLPKPEQICFE